MKAFQCDKCGDFFQRKARALQNKISFEGPRGPRTLEIDFLYRCTHRNVDGRVTEHPVHFCDDCLLWFLDEYKGSIMVEVGREEDVTEDDKQPAS